MTFSWTFCVKDFGPKSIINNVLNNLSWSPFGFISYLMFLNVDEVKIILKNSKCIKNLRFNVILRIQCCLWYTIEKLFKSHGFNAHNIKVLYLLLSRTSPKSILTFFNSLNICISQINRKCGYVISDRRTSIWV